MFLKILDVCDMLLRIVDTECLFYRAWFLTKFLRKRRPNYSPYSESLTLSDKAGKRFQRHVP